LSQDKEDEIDIIFKKPRKEGGSLVLTLPDYFCDRVKMTANSKLELIVYSSFFILRHRQGFDYNEEPMPKTLELLDMIFGIFEKERELKKRRYSEGSLDLQTYDSEMREISKTLKETNSKLLELLKEKKTSSRIPFIPSVESPEKLQSILREIFKEHYGDTQ
jgi:hypothetical protein